MIICPKCHPWNQQSRGQTKKKSNRITKDAKQKLRQFFKDKNWPRNKSLPKANGDSEVDKLITDLGLERSQVARQLAQWKKDTYDKAQLQLLIEPGSIQETIVENMSMTNSDFVDNFLGLMIEGGEIDGNANTTNLIQSLELQPQKELKKEALKYIKANKEHVCFKSLTCEEHLTNLLIRTSFTSANHLLPYVIPLETCINISRIDSKKDKSLVVVPFLPVCHLTQH